MRFYTKQHNYYCGIDLHARSMYICIVDEQGKTVFHRNRKASAEALLKAIEPFREDIVVAVECMFVWYWLADLCAKEKIPFVLGHALYMKAIHGGKSKNDKIDSKKIATLLRGGNIPMAYVYPRKMRSTRDLLRRRNHLMRKRSELLAHIQNTNSQYNLPEFGKKLAYKANREVLPSTSPTLPSARASRSIFNYSTSTTSSSMTSNSISSKRPKWTMPTAGIVCEVSPESAKSSVSFSSTKSTISNGFPESRTSSPIAAWSNAPENQLERSSVPKIARSETLTSSGLSLKRLVSS